MAIGLLTGILAGKVAFDAITHFIDFWNSDEYFLKEFKAVPLGTEGAPEQCKMVQNLARKAEIPAPRLYVIDDPFPNAFAVGRDAEHAAICLTKGLICNLSLPEQEGILGHEMTHIKNNDIMVLTAAAFLKDFAVAVVPGAALETKDAKKMTSNNQVAVAAATMLGTMVLGSLMEQALSRNREFAADKGSGELTGAPDILANALERIDKLTANMVMRGANANNAHLFLVCPAGVDLKGLFNSHPPVAERASRLREQARAMGRLVP